MRAGYFRKHNVVCLAGILAFVFVFFPSADSDDRKSGGRTVNPPHISSIYTELNNFNDLTRYYKPAYFARLDRRGYKKPDIEEWVSSLEPFDNPAVDDAFVRVWFKGGKVRFFYIQNDTTRSGMFYAINRISIECIGISDYKVRLFVTPAGVVKWEYIYNDGLLGMRKYYAFDFNLADDSIRCDRLWGYERIEYWEDSVVPKHRYVYGYYKLQDEDWYQRVDYDPGGNKLRTVNAGSREDDRER